MGIEGELETVERVISCGVWDSPGVFSKVTGDVGCDNWTNVKLVLGWTTLEKSDGHSIVVVAFSWGPDNIQSCSCCDSLAHCWCSQDIETRGLRKSSRGKGQSGGRDGGVTHVEVYDKNC